MFEDATLGLPLAPWTQPLFNLYKVPLSVCLGLIILAQGEVLKLLNIVLAGHYGILLGMLAASVDNFLRTFLFRFHIEVFLIVTLNWPTLT